MIRIPAVLLLFVCLIQIESVAQSVTVTDDDAYVPANSAILDVKATGKGILIPRLQLDDATTAVPVTSPAKGLLIFNDGGTEDEGFYYWDGNQWNQLAFSDTSNFTTAGQIHAEMYEPDPVTITSINLTTTGTYYGWISATEGFTAGTSYMYFQNNATADRLVVGASGAGKYLCTVVLSFGGSSNPIITGGVFKNNTLQANLVLKRKLNSNGDVGSASLSGIISLASGDYIDMRYTANSNNERIDIYTQNFHCSRISD